MVLGLGGQDGLVPGWQQGQHQSPAGRSLARHEAKPPSIACVAAHTACLQRQRRPCRLQPATATLYRRKTLVRNRQQRRPLWNTRPLRSKVRSEKALMWLWWGVVVDR